MFKIDKHEKQGIFVMFFVLPMILMVGMLFMAWKSERVFTCREGFVEVSRGICVAGYDARKER